MREFAIGQTQAARCKITANPSTNPSNASQIAKHCIAKPPNRQAKPPIEKTQRKRLNESPVEKNLAKYPECEPCPGNATQGLKHEFCRRIVWIPVAETASTWPDDISCRQNHT